MRTFGKIVLIFLFIPLFLSFLFATSARFQFLNFNFWNGVLNRPGFYEQLVTTLKKGAEQQLSQEGFGNKCDSGRCTFGDDSTSDFGGYDQALGIFCGWSHNFGSNIFILQKTG